MRLRIWSVVVGLIVFVAAAWPNAQQSSPVQGYLNYDASLSQGWAVRDYLKSTNAPMPLWNSAKQKLLDGKQIFSHTIEHLNAEDYCASAPHYDYIFFEMQHSTMTWAEKQPNRGSRNKCPRRLHCLVSRGGAVQLSIASYQINRTNTKSNTSA